AVWAGWLLWLYPRWQSAPGLLAGLLTLGGAAALLGERSGIGTWVYLAAVCTLAAWDLSAVSGRFRRVAVVVGEAALLGAHVRRLAVVSGLALLLGLLGPGLVPAGFNFHVALLLALLLALGLGRLLRSI
ncbi:MAG: hypothetical protein KC425_27155, partial [Anaerolineales bacterium]|nr:hypothetical protein [Anaerolineales bacterium]